MPYILSVHSSGGREPHAHGPAGVPVAPGGIGDELDAVGPSQGRKLIDLASVASVPGPLSAATSGQQPGAAERCVLVLPACSQFTVQVSPVQRLNTYFGPAHRVRRAGCFQRPVMESQGCVAIVEP